VLAIVCAVLALPALAVAQKPGELPITTSSTEARDLFLEARDLVLNVEGERAAPLLDRAIKMDPAFALAHLYRFMAGGSFTVVRPSLEKAAELADRVSPGERLFILGLKAGFDGEATKGGELLDQLLKAFPNDRQVVYVVGLHYFYLTDYATAQRYLERVTTLDPTFAAEWGCEARSTVTCRTLTEIVDATRYRGRRIDLLSVDTEGHDLQVLQSLDFDRYRPALIAVETHARTLEELHATPLYAHVAALGYSLAGWAGLTLLWVDRARVPAEGPPELSAGA